MAKKNLHFRERLLFPDDPAVAKLFPLWKGKEIVYMWAERGRICWEFSGNNSYSTMDWRDAAERTLALSEMVMNTPEASYPDQRRKIQLFVEQMEKVIRKARAQGGPFDKDAAYWKSKFRAKSVSVPTVPVTVHDPFDR